MPARVSVETYAEFDRLVASGVAASTAARQVGISAKTGQLRAKGLKARSGQRFAKLDEDLSLPAPRSESRLRPEARRALEDFEFFRLRYFGHVSTPWQVDAANRMVGLAATDEEEFVVVNVPPGAGKSTTFTHDIVAWMIVRDRSTRVLIGSRTERQAKQYVGRLKTSFERTSPAVASDKERKKGLAVDAVATLAGDFGRFKPTNPDVWRMEEFTVAQVNDIAASDKERTVSAYGMDGGFLGGRYDVVVWDDLVDKRSMRTADAREALINMWETEAETRLEPGGLLILQGQRMRSDDLYRYALDLLGDDPDEDDDEPEMPSDGVEQPRRERKYHHVIYRAHFEDSCDPENPQHRRDSPAWNPDGTGGCLLDPIRLPWRRLEMVRRNKAERFLVMYQQEDTDPQNAVFQLDWVTGCWDPDRGACELPRGLEPPLISVATADPSPTKFWAIEWWVYHPKTEQRFLMDVIRQSMEAPDFLDWNYNDGVFSGVMDEWQQRSRDLGLPITHWVVEANAAQRFILQYDHARRWQRLNSVDVIPHQTHRNKADPEYGVQTMAPHWKFGRVRLPGKQGNPGRMAAMKLVDEITKWPEGSTDDTVMAAWFFEYSLPGIHSPLTRPIRRFVPSWQRQRYSA